MDNYRKTPTIYQMEATECGAASLAMIFAYFGKYMPLEQMRVEVGVSRDGCVAGNLMRAAKRFGLECHGYSKKLEFLKTVSTPCIIHWNFNHFVVFEGFKNGYAYLNDPAVGRRKLTMDELDDGFTGIVLTFSYTDKFIKEKAPHNLLGFMKDKLKGQYNVIFELLFIGFLLMFPGLVIPVLSQTFMDDVLIGGYTDWINKILIFMGACVLMKLGLNWYRSRLLSRFSSKMTILSGYGFLRHLLRLPMSFFDQRYAGDLVSRMDSSSEVSAFMSNELAKTALNLIVAVFYLIILIFYSPALSVIGILNAFICVAAVLIGNKTIASSSVKIELSQGKLFGTVCAGLNITDTIKASGAETEYTSRILGHQAKSVSDEQQLIRFQQIIDAIPTGVNKLSDVLILLVGGILAVNGKMTIGMLVAFNSLYDSFCEPVNDLVGFSTKIQKLKAGICRVEDIEKHPEDAGLAKKADVLSAMKLKGEIELENISFGYSRLKPPLVENLSFHLNPGESVAFVGASGCGKSTAAKLASGLYQPWSGRVLLDEKDMSSIPNESLRGSISTVSQNIVIFSGSVRDNICLWNDAISNDTMIQAAKDACIHDFIISQPEGYDYILTEDASNLSGGQRQRLEIARALAVNPSILIMDEATSALDAITEKQILDNIRKRGCTCIIVAHRLSAIRDCNHIIVMKSGKVVQEGTHESLVKEIGCYRTLLMNG